LAKNKDISEKDIKELHRLFYYRIDKDEAGQYRKVRVFIKRFKIPRFPSRKASAVLCVNLSPVLPAQRKALHPVEFCAKAHKDFVFIHPFIDGNGRLARLLMNLILLQEGYNIAVISPVNRPTISPPLKKAHTDDGDFIALIADSVKETQKDYIRFF